MANKFFAAIKARFFTTAADTAIDIGVSGDTHARIAIDAGGKVSWGAGNSSPDVNLYRDAENVLRTDDSLKALSLLAGAIKATNAQGNSTTFETTTYQSTSTTLQVIDSTTAAAVKYVVHASSSASSEVVEILALARSADVSHVEYGRIALNDDVAAYDVTMSGGVIQLKVTPVSSSATTFVVSKQVLI